MPSCLICNKPLSVLESVIRGVGPICAAKRDAENEEETNDVVDLPFDPVTKNIICRKIGDKQHFNIYQAIKHHSPSGMSWGELIRLMYFNMTVRAKQLKPFGMLFNFTQTCTTFSFHVPFVFLARIKMVEMKCLHTSVIITPRTFAPKLLTERLSFGAFFIPPTLFVALRANPSPTLWTSIRKKFVAVITKSFAFMVNRVTDMFCFWRSHSSTVFAPKLKDTLTTKVRVSVSTIWNFFIASFAEQLRQFIHRLNLLMDMILYACLRVQTGSGPSDFALNILEHFVRDFEEPTIKCWNGKCCRTSWDLHHDFKRDFLCDIPPEGGEIKGSEIRRWLKYMMEEKRKNV